MGSCQIQKEIFKPYSYLRVRKFGLGRQHTFSLRWYFNFLLSCVLSHISIQHICQRKIKFNYPRKPTNISQRSGNIQKEEVKLSKGWNQRLLCTISCFLFWIYLLLEIYLLYCPNIHMIGRIPYMYIYIYIKYQLLMISMK